MQIAVSDFLLRVSGNCTRSTCSAGQKCFELTSTTACIYTECMDSAVLGVELPMEQRVVGESFPAVCETGYEARGEGANITCMGNGRWAISSSYCHRIYSSGWMLLARFGSGNGESVYNTWTEAGRDDNSNENIPNECKDVNTSNTCTRHFRSGLVDDWTALNPTEAKFSLYIAGIEEVYVTFNATDTDSITWFAQERILSTSFTDLKTNSTSNFFSISGANTYRRFYINKSYGGCNNDQGWIRVIDGTGVCFYENAVAEPSFVFSRNNQSGVAGIDSLTADVLAIFVKV
ncbi:uncharacterized protein LOC117327502 isoform X2 [Pecten maximus]|uniref:uncharacterized protein LOC117327502 isoform X2 n=1 Tax=Pecten maximus TaxID=6579 RepID=UPI001458781B|nr:uncharacterized protein LOC117327502 isoform X2 [Pecten maximus]